MEQAATTVTVGHTDTDKLNKLEAIRHPFTFSGTMWELHIECKSYGAWRTGT